MVFKDNISYFRFNLHIFIKLLYHAYIIYYVSIITVMQIEEQCDATKFPKIDMKIILQ